MKPAMLRTLMLRDLDSVRRSIEAYPSDEALWAKPAGIANTGGTLALHIAGNLHHFVGHLVGGESYTRDRDAEFAARGLPRSQVVAKLEGARAAVDRALGAATEESLAAPLAQQVGGKTVETGEWLAHLLSHLAYHLGQLDYHRRIVTGEGAPVVEAMQIAPLRDVTARKE